MTEILSIIGAVTGIASFAVVIYGFALWRGKVDTRLEILWEVVWDRMIKSSGNPDNTLSDRVNNGLPPELKSRISQRTPKRADLKKIIEIARKECLPVEQVISVIMNYTR